jgi:CBS domain-containing protein
MTGGPHIVRDVMTTAVVSVDRGTPFKEIVRLLRERNVSALPVLQADGRVDGVVSEADLLPKEEFRDADPSRLTQMRRLDDVLKAGSVLAADLMTAPAVTAVEDDTLSRAARIMAKAKVKRLPVVDAGGRLRGIVSRGDLLKVFLREDEDIAEEIRREVVGYLFPGEPCPVRVTVTDGTVTLSGRAADTARIPVASRLVRSVEGVVDVRWDLDRPTPGRRRSAAAGPPR